jgi:cardiolipin synthase
MNVRKNLIQTLTAGVAALSVLTGCGAHAVVGAANTELGQVDAFAKAAKSQAGQMQLFVMPDSGPKPLLDAIASAKKSIKFELYMMTYNDDSKLIADALVAKAKEKVDVQVILEAQPYMPVDPANPKQFNVNAPAMQALMAGGVRVARSSPRFVYTHEKAMVIDSKIAYIMTMNMTNSAFTKNREYVVADRSPSDVKEVGAIFDADWTQTPIVPRDPDLVVSPDNSRKRILTLIDHAKTSLVVQCEFINDPEIVQHLAAAQNQRHVKMVLMMSYQKGGGSYDPNGDSTKLLDGVGIKSFTFTKTVTMHAKCVIADGTSAYVGSENLTANSLDKNREMGVIVTDPTVVAKLISITSIDWAANPPGVAPAPVVPGPVVPAPVVPAPAAK